MMARSAKAAVHRGRAKASLARPWLVIALGCLLALQILFLACGPPPDGWEGGGRRYTLPTGTPGNVDAGSDTGGGGGGG